MIRLCEVERSHYELIFLSEKPSAFESSAVIFAKNDRRAHSFLMNGGALQRALPSCIATGRYEENLLICKKNSKEV